MRADLAQPPRAAASDEAPRPMAGRVSRVDDLVVWVVFEATGDLEWGPCPWLSRGAVPVDDDDCLVVFDANHQPFALIFNDQSAGGLGGPAGGVLAGTYPNPAFAVDMATQAELDAHTGLGSTAHGGLIPSSQKAAASGVASLDAATRVPNAQLGSGAPDATMFLRGDRTWAAPAAPANGPWTAIPFANSWTDYENIAGGWQNGQYRIRADGAVELRGLIKKTGNFSTQAISTALPVAARPAKKQISMVFTEGGASVRAVERVDLGTDGVLTVDVKRSDAVAWININGCVYYP